MSACVLSLLAARPACALPDLQVGLLFATEENDACMAQVHYILQIVNAGDEAIPSYDLYIVFDSTDQPDITKIDSYPGKWHKSDKPLAAGDLNPLELWWQNPPEGVPKGDYKGWLFLDPKNTVVESDETNNWEGPVFVSVTPPVCAPPNLKVKTFEATAQDGTIQYACTVTNDGLADVALPFRLDLYHHQKKMPGYDTAGDQHVEIPSLKIGETYEWTPTWAEVPDGMMHSWCVVDEDDRILESAESDNVADLKIGICQTCPSCPEGDEPVPQFCSCGGQLADTGYYCCDGEVMKKPCDWVPPEPVDENAGGDASSGEPVTIEAIEPWGEPGIEPGPDVVVQPDLQPVEVVAEIVAEAGPIGPDVPGAEAATPPTDEGTGTIDEGIPAATGGNGCSVGMGGNGAGGTAGGSSPGAGVAVVLIVLVWAVLLRRHGSGAIRLQ